MLELKFENIKWCSGNHRNSFVFSKTGKMGCFPSKNYVQLQKDFKKQFEEILEKKKSTGTFFDNLDKVKVSEYIHLNIRFIKRVKPNKKDLVPPFLNTTPDIDNICKTLFDLLKKCDIIKDDKYIVEINAKKELKETEDTYKARHYDVILNFK